LYQALLQKVDERIGKVYVKNLGLDLSKVTAEDLESIATFLEDIIGLELRKRLGNIDYDLTVNVWLSENTLNIEVDVEVYAHEGFKAEGEVLIDEALDKGLEKLEDELTRRFSA